MKIIHTADWHLGASFGPKTRTRESRELLKWLCKSIHEQNIAAVIIAGDIFDTKFPPNEASELYYTFLCEACRAGAREVIVTAGNHDSPRYMEAPRELLGHMHIHVFGSLRPNPAEATIPLSDAEGTVQAVVCAVPFPHERDLRDNTPFGEKNTERADALCQALLKHYHALYEYASLTYPGVPVIATAHLSAYDCKGGVGKIIEAGTFPPLCMDDFPPFAYVALGHLHSPQSLPAHPNMRYSGSLMRMNFELDTPPREITILDTEHMDAPQSLPLPVFQRLESITGDMEAINKRIQELKQCGESVWLKVENTGPFQNNLSGELATLCAGSEVSVILSTNRSPNPAILHRANPETDLRRMEPENVFRGILEQSADDEETRAKLLEAFRFAVGKLNEEGGEAQP